MNKNILLLLLFFLLGGLAAYFVYNGNTDKDPGMLSARDLLTVDADAMDEILIERKNDLDLHFVKKSNGWYVNEYYKVNPNTMAHLVSTISKMDMHFIPPKASVKNILADMEKIGLDVTVSNKGKKMKKFTVGANTLKSDATYFLPDGYNQPYAMTMRTFDGTLRDRFNYNLESWKDRTLVALDAKDIAYVKMVYPKGMKNSFEMKLDGNETTITPLDPFREKYSSKPIKSRVDAFLIGFDLIGAEGYDNRNSKRDSIANLTPFLDLTMTTRSGEELKYSFVPFRDVIDPDVNTKDLEDLQKIERYFVVNRKTNDFLVIQQRVFKEVLRSYDYFFK